MMDATGRVRHFRNFPAIRSISSIDIEGVEGGVSDGFEEVVAFLTPDAAAELDDILVAEPFNGAWVIEAERLWGSPTLGESDRSRPI